MLLDPAGYPHNGWGELRAAGQWGKELRRAGGLPIGSLSFRQPTTDIEFQGFAKILGRDAIDASRREVDKPPMSSSEQIICETVNAAKRG